MSTAAGAAGQLDFQVHLATAAGTGGLAVLELYGPGASDALAVALHLPVSRLPAPGALRLAVLRDCGGESIDDVLVSRFDAEGSWCGLAGWSVSCHGGAVVTSRVLEVFTDLGGRRSSSGDLLSSNLALDDLQRAAHSPMMEARTERAATYFLRIFAGGLGSRLAELLGGFESARGGLRAVVEGLTAMIGEAGPALRLGRPLRLLIAGRPNAGKSTLFNALLGEERVIVSAASGTTRDLIEETIEIEGYPVILMDSAGLRSSIETDAVEREGIRRALSAERDAVLLLRDASAGLAVADGLESAVLADSGGEEGVMTVWSKGDLVEAAGPQAPGLPAGELIVSALRGTGLGELREAIRSRWLGPPESVSLPAAPFRPELVEAFHELAARLTQLRPADLDSVRRAFIECLGLREEFAAVSGE